MKKMEVMMELLTEEIESFKKSVDKLEGLSGSLKDLKIDTDNSKSERHIKDFLKEQKRTVNVYKEKTKEIQQGIRSARLVPNWLASFFCVALSIHILSLSYFAHHFIMFEDRRTEAFNEGREAGCNNSKAYFEDHPVIHEDFKKWSRKRDSIPNRR